MLRFTSIRNRNHTVHEMHSKLSTVQKIFNSHIKVKVNNEPFKNFERHWTVNFLYFGKYNQLTNNQNLSCIFTLILLYFPKIWAFRSEISLKIVYCVIIHRNQDTGIEYFLEYFSFENKRQQTNHSFYLNAPHTFCVTQLDFTRQ